MFKYMRKDEGFTLVELMVVVLIIGILVAIAIPIFNNASQTAKEKTCAANIRTIKGSVQQYLATNPTATTVDLAGLVSGNYIQETPVCPINNAATYTVSGNDVTHDHAPVAP